MVFSSTLLAILADVGGGELMLILFVVLMLFGGDKMPQLAKSIGKSLREFKKAANEVEREIKKAIDEVPDTPDVGAPFRRALEDKPKRLTPVAPAAAPVTEPVISSIPPESLAPPETIVPPPAPNGADVRPVPPPNA
ncbi:twin-arginine translocase TatA/TatE family subunit [Opitutus terrae]|uniref:Sec-independent protein translocase protein TatA n=1 Tax=Opitutus terrae (strain DSM 11246 / JCM 15787 / PB90-1) TaxID=452637 RepID=B1ZUR0_OPITP|nr:twin-arginine translocase TatA/TatE family subunit [Opitutus terrae]ACB74944.1 twin-arginine translocation protein, TatA/E family subunit [Opitutus terrae PB90-1]